MAVQGIFTSSSGIQGGRAGDFASGLLQYEAVGSAPVLALSSGMESLPAGDTMVTWWEESRLTGRVSITNNAGTGVTFVVADASEVIANKIIMVETTGEYVFVEAVSGNTLTVLRGFAGTGIAAINGSVTPVESQIISTGFEEGSGQPVSISNVGASLFNYTQIFRTPWKYTRTSRSVQYNVENPALKMRKDAASMHAEELELSMLFGYRSEGQVGGSPFRTMDGIVTQIEKRQTTDGTLVTESGGTTQSELNDFVGAVFSNNIKGQPNERMGVCDNQALRVVNDIVAANGQMQLETGQTAYGMAITKWITPFGSITLLTHPLLNERAAWRGNLYLLHPGAIRTRYLDNTFEDTADTNSTRAGVDADSGVFTTEMSVQYLAAKTGGVLYGMTAAA